MYNKVIIIGRLTAQPELVTTSNEKSVTRVTLAVNRRFKSQNGEREADFIQIVAWRGVAETIAQYCGKGSQIGVIGRIQTRNYENQQGQRVYITEVVAQQVTLLDTRNNQQGGQPQNQGNFQNGNNQNYQSQYGNQQQTPNFGRESQQGSFFHGQTTNPVDISDDDLPF